MSQNDFFICLDDLEYSPEYLADFVSNEIAEEDWYIFDCGKIRWTVQEDYSTIRTECTNFRRTIWFHELLNLFTVPINFGDIFFSRTPPPGVPPHVDRNRPVAINLPVFGHYKDSPILFFNSFSAADEATRFHHSTISPITQKKTALLFNPQKIHGVINETDRDRCLLSFWWRNLKFDDAKRMWGDGSLINWEQNKLNKYVKVLR